MSKLRNRQYQDTSNTVYDVATWVSCGVAYARVIQTGELLVDGVDVDTLQTTLDAVLTAKGFTNF